MFFFTDALHGVVLGPQAIAWTKDGGRNWHPAKIKANVKKINLSGLWFSSAKLGWADGGTQGQPSYPGLLLKTTDGGRTWRRVALPKTIGSLNSVWFGPHGQHGRLLPYRSTFFWQTADGGKTFTQVNVGQVFQVGCWIGSWEKMVLAGAGGQGKWFKNGGYWAPRKPVILHTTDGGKTWAVQQPPPGRTGILTDVCAISPSQAWVGSTLGYARTNPMTALPWLLHTTDGGKTWPDVMNHILSIQKIFFLDASHGWAVGGQGGSPNEPPEGVLRYGGR